MLMPAASEGLGGTLGRAEGPDGTWAGGPFGTALAGGEAEGLAKRVFAALIVFSGFVEVGSLNGSAATGLADGGAAAGALASGGFATRSAMGTKISIWPFVSTLKARSSTRFCTKSSSSF